MTIRLKLIALATLASVSVSSMAKVEERELQNFCYPGQGNALVVKKDVSKYTLLFVRGEHSRMRNTYEFHGPFLYGDSFAIEIDDGRWTPSNNILLRIMTADADEAVIFNCPNSVYNTGGYVSLDISADTYELLIKQKWLSK